MYAKKVHLLNYGPIESLQLELPFEGETPKPIVLVGENGSGKSILLSHIVNGLIMAKGLAFPETPEVEADRVYNADTLRAVVLQPQ
jgi:predicted ATP-binding protein involved in virulence